MVENQGRMEEGAVGCHWWRQPGTLVVIDDDSSESTSVGRDIEEGWKGGRRGLGRAHLWVEGSLLMLVLPPPPSMIARVVGCRHQWQPTTPSSLRPWFSTITTTFLSLGDVEREGKREKKRKEREREREIADWREVWVTASDDVGRSVSLGREEGKSGWWVRVEKKGNLGTKNPGGLESIKKI